MFSTLTRKMHITQRLEDVKSRFFIDTLKKEQEEALFNFVCKRDVFVNLPTGFGKSLIYQMAPMVMKELGLCINPIIIVISPLVSLMQDQVNQLEKQGLSAVSLMTNSFLVTIHLCILRRNRF